MRTTIIAAALTIAAGTAHADPVCMRPADLVWAPKAIQHDFATIDIMKRGCVTSPQIMGYLAALKELRADAKGTSRRDRIWAIMSRENP